jgi:hypothetical protein
MYSGYVEPLQQEELFYVKNSGYHNEEILLKDWITLPPDKQEYSRKYY